jgi:hypothetical protein
MGGTIAIQEERSTIDKFKSWYKEKMIDNGRAAKVEEGIVTTVDILGDCLILYGVIGGAAITIVGAIESFGIGTALGAAIGTGFASITGAIAAFGKKFVPKVIISGKRTLEGIFIGEDGSSEKINVKDIDLTDALQNLSTEAINHGVNIATIYNEHKKTTVQSPTDTQPEPPIIEAAYDGPSMKK